LWRRRRRTHATIDKNEVIVFATNRIKYNRLFTRESFFLFLFDCSMKFA
jgi:hypothetical protein